ncbi:hypothetical protein PFISCL1PPCAC_14937, partial [Pristionchus fissidentatus]
RELLKFLWMSSTTVDYGGLANALKLKCPKCNRLFSKDPHSHPHTLSCGHLLCTSCCGSYKTRTCPTCKSTSREPFVKNLAIFDFQEQFMERLEKMRKGESAIDEEDEEIEVKEEMDVECSECGKEIKRGEGRACWDTFCNKYRDPLCWKCIGKTHSGHITAPFLPHSDHQMCFGAHKAVDHSRFPDRKIIDAGGIQFKVSASFLATHSPYFNKLFYGTPEKRDQLHFKMDEDPSILGDLLDLMYTKHKKIKCCEMCQRKTEGRLQLARTIELLPALKHFDSLVR